jgi:hypothetical protein
MNNEQLKNGLRQLAAREGAVGRITDELLEGLDSDECAPPSDEVKQRFLDGLHLRIQKATLSDKFRRIDKGDFTR